MLNEKSRTLALYRLERAKELIDDSRKLFESGSYKSSNNRAYYAIFYAMRAVLALDYDDFYLASREEAIEQIEGAEKFYCAVEAFLKRIE